MAAPLRTDPIEHRASLTGSPRVRIQTQQTSPRPTLHISVTQVAVTGRASKNCSEEALTRVAAADFVPAARGPVGSTRSPGPTRKCFWPAGLGLQVELRPWI